MNQNFKLANFKINMTKLIILLAFCASFAASNSHKSKHCNETLFAECSNRYIMFGDATFDFPTTEKEMKERCRFVFTK